MASESERKIINAVECPTCKAKPGHACVIVRGINAGQLSSLHPGRKALLPKLDARRKHTKQPQSEAQHGQ